MTPLLFYILIAMFLVITGIKISIIVQKKQDIAILKQNIQENKLNLIGKSIVSKIRHDKKFEQTLSLLVFGDCFMFALHWSIGLLQFIFTIFIIMLINSKVEYNSADLVM